MSEAKREFFIYALACPVTGEVRYVGKTVATVGVRRSSHRADARRVRDLHVYKWWRKVEREHGRLPVPVTLETGWGTTNHIAQRKRAWIELHRSNGLRLTNLTDGGEGITGFAHSDETRRAGPPDSLPVIARSPHSAPTRGWLHSRRLTGMCLAVTIAALAMVPSAFAAEARAAHRSAFIIGTAVVAKGAPIAGGRIGAETLDGRSLKIRWGQRGDRRVTKSNGAFALPTAGLPRRFVIVVRGGRAMGQRTRTTFRTVYPTPSAAYATAPISIGTTLQVTAFRQPWSSSAGGLRAARNAVLRSLRWPHYLVLGMDDRVNSQFVSSVRIRRLVRTHHGMGGLMRDLRELVAAREVVARPGLGWTTKTPQARATRAGSTCSKEQLLTNASGLAFCLLTQGLSLAPDIAAQGQLQQITVQLNQILAEVSQLQVALQDDFVALLATQTLDAYASAAAQTASTTANILAGINDLQVITGYAGVAADQTAVDAAAANLRSLLSSTAAGGLANPATANLLQQQITATGVSGQGTLPAAWQAIRAQQQLGSLGATTPNGQDAALGQGTTLFTNEMSSAFSVVSDYWYQQTFLLAVLSASYWNDVYTSTPPAPPTTAQQATAEQLGGVCPQGQPCPGSIASYLLQQVLATPLSVPAGTVIDPTMNLIWGTAITSPVAGSNGLNSKSSDTGLPVDVSTGNTIAQELPGQLNSGASTPWSNVNPNVTAVATNIAAGPPSFTLNWGLPTAGFAGLNSGGVIYDPSQTPQLGIPGGGSGLLGGLLTTGPSQLDLSNLTGLTTPSAFPPATATTTINASVTGNWWWTAGSNAFLCQQPAGAYGCYGGGFNYYPAGVMSFISNTYISQTKSYSGWVSAIGQPVAAPQLTGAILVQSPVPSAQFQYPAVYPSSVVANPAQVLNLIEAYR